MTLDLLGLLRSTFNNEKDVLSKYVIYWGYFWLIWANCLLSSNLCPWTQVWLRIISGLWSVAFSDYIGSSVLLLFLSILHQLFLPRGLVILTFVPWPLKPSQLWPLGLPRKNQLLLLLHSGWFEQNTMPVTVLLADFCPAPGVSPHPTPRCDHWHPKNIISLEDA